MQSSFVVMVFVSMVTKWYPIATEQLPPINNDNLDPGAAHVCKRTEKEGYTVTVSFTQYFTETTNTWCFGLPPRCTEYRIASRGAYRRETRYRERVHYFCCNDYRAQLGLNYCVPDCDYNCYAEENQGYCVTPDNCRCNPGFSGRYCESGCASDRWGPNCTNTCNCGSYGACDTYTGNCICHIGYTGADCSQPCINSFGLNCVHPCVCENGATCNNVNGKCTCAPGFYGAYCHKECDPSSSGEQGCEQTCPCQNGGQCDEITGECDCAPGYEGTYCTVPCDEFHWWKNCMYNCSCNFGVCDPVTGRCSCAFGYSGERCEVKCPDGYYGNGCLTKCGCFNDGECYFDSNIQEIRCNCNNTGFHGDVCQIRDCAPGQYVASIASTGYPVCVRCNCAWGTTESCHPLNGSCTCEKGYQGTYCNDECEMPFYGDKCQEVCRCAHGDCHHVTGQCSQCYAGFIGVNCTEPCPDETWGLNCANKCECRNRAICHAKTGYCECMPGFHGVRCEQLCPKGKYGRDCVSDCDCNPQTSECNSYNGVCQCLAGFTGENCEDQCPPGFYGVHCHSTCQCDDRTSVCDPRSGVCHCKSGWYGSRCDKRCKARVSWGPYCSEECSCNGNGDCDPESGTCGCYRGFLGITCDRDSNGISIVGKQTSEKESNDSSIGTTPIIIAAVIPSIILLLILAAVLYHCKRKVRRLKEENSQVFFQNNGDTIIPNGGTQIGVNNPTYVADNLRNERRYPHLSSRVSTSNPPLPPRCESDEACVNTDDVKLRVSMNGKGRPESSQYADVDDVEDRYTTLKSLSMGMTQCDDPNDESASCNSSTQNRNGNMGFQNLTYAETDHPITFENSHLDHPDASIGPSSETFVKKQAFSEYDVPKKISVQNISPNTNESHDYMNHKCENKSSSHLNNKVTLNGNPYDIPNGGLRPNKGWNSAKPSDYQTPTNSGYMVPTNNKPMNENNLVNNEAVA